MPGQFPAEVPLPLTSTLAGRHIRDCTSTFTEAAARCRLTLWLQHQVCLGMFAVSFERCTLRTSQPVAPGAFCFSFPLSKIRPHSVVLVNTAGPLNCRDVHDIFLAVAEFTSDCGNVAIVLGSLADTGVERVERGNTR